MALTVIQPITIYESMLQSSTVPENDYPVWSSAVTYGIGDRVIYNHIIWESLKVNNLFKYPGDGTTSTWWLKVSSTNRWRMLDGESSSQTSQVNGFTVVLRPGFFNAFAMFNLAGSTVDVTLRNTPGGTIQLQQTYSLDGFTPGDWYEYWFSSFRQKTDLVVSGLTPAVDSELTITITGTTAKCGILTIGDMKILGTTEPGADFDPKDYSYISTDSFGNTKIEKRRNTVNINCTAFVPLMDANDVATTLRELLAVPAAYFLVEASEYDALKTYGLGVGKLVYPLGDTVNLTMKVQGLI